MVSSTSCGRVLGVAGGSGGLGTSVLAAACAMRGAAAGLSTVCVDGAQLGGGLDLTFGLEQESGVRWPDLARARGELDGAALLPRLPAVDGVPVLSFTRAAPVALPGQVVSSVLVALRSAAELVVVDLPGAESPLFTPMLDHANSVVVLVGRRVRELAAASVVAPLVATRVADAWLVVRGGGHINGEFSAAVSQALDLPLLAVLEDDRWVDADLLHGVPPASRSRGPLRATAERVLARLAREPSLETAS